MTERLSLIYVLIALACMLLVACAGIPDWGGDPGTKAAEVAVEMKDSPYRYGGKTPDDGFDCSGLVHYSYQQAGVSVPRTTETQRSASKPVSNPKKGDLVFFNLNGWHASHVGIYIGDYRFVHAPSTGKHVRIDSLEGRYWKKHFTGYRRLEAVVALEDNPRTLLSWLKMPYP